MLSYCHNAKQALSRLKKLYANRSQEIVCAKMQVPSKTLAEFARVHSEGFCEYPNIQERSAFWDTYLAERETIRDDAVPSAPLKEMDQGLYGGLFGGDVRFLCDPATGHISSMVYPVLKDLAEIDNLVFRTDCRWYKRYVDQLDVFTNNSKDKYGISHLIAINGLNFVFELIGATAAYIAVEENPELVQKAFQLAYKVNLQVQKTFFEKVPSVFSGTCSNFLQWLPGRIVSESLDPFHMTSVDYFEKWGREPVEKLFSKFDGGIVHIHGNGRHLLEAVSVIKGLKAICLGDDKGYPPAFEILADIRKKVGNTPLVCTVEFPQFEKAMKEHCLTGGVFYNVIGVPDNNTANICMDSVRHYRT